MARLLFTLVFVSVLALATMYQVSVVQFFVEYKAENTPGGQIWKKEMGKNYSRFRREHNGFGLYWGRNLKQAFYGVLVHEMTHVWQWYGNQPKPSDAVIDVVEGIADYVRLKAGLVDPSWVDNGERGPWDKRYYGITARFFDYIGSFVKRDFVILLNEKMKFGYNVNFFEEITGETVSQLWRDYKHHYNEEL